MHNKSFTKGILQSKKINKVTTNINLILSADVGLTDKDKRILQSCCLSNMDFCIYSVRDITFILTPKDNCYNNKQLYFDMNKVNDGKWFVSVFTDDDLGSLENNEPGYLLIRRLSVISPLFTEKKIILSKHVNRI